MEIIIQSSDSPKINFICFSVAQIFHWSTCNGKVEWAAPLWRIYKAVELSRLLHAWKIFLWFKKWVFVILGSICWHQVDVLEVMFMVGSEYPLTHFCLLLWCTSPFKFQIYPLIPPGSALFSLTRAQMYFSLLMLLQRTALISWKYTSSSCLVVFLHLLRGSTSFCPKINRTF